MGDCPLDEPVQQQSPDEGYSQDRHANGENHALAGGHGGTLPERKGAIVQCWSAVGADGPGLGIVSRQLITPRRVVRCRVFDSKSFTPSQRGGTWFESTAAPDSSELRLAQRCNRCVDQEARRRTRALLWTTPNDTPRHDAVGYWYPKPIVLPLPLLASFALTLASRVEDGRHELESRTSAVDTLERGATDPSRSKIS